MTLQMNGMPRFASQFVFKRVNEEKQKKLQGWHLPHPTAGSGEVKVEVDQPRKGNVTVNVNVKDPFNKTKIHEAVFSMAESLGLDVLFKPDKIPSMRQMQQASKRLKAAFQAELAKNTNYPNAAPKMFTNGHALFIRSQSYQEERAVSDAYMALKQAGVIQEYERTLFGMGIKEPFFEGHQIHIDIDPDSEYGKQRMRNMLD